MTWTLPTCSYRQFRRNPIDLVVTQLRFHPILKISDRVPELQDRVRGRFPRFNRNVAETVTIEGLAPGAAQITRQEQFQFEKAVEGTGRLTVSQSHLALETKHHASRAGFQDDFQVGLTALELSCAPIQGTRLGLRYVNVIDPEEIHRDTGERPGWETLVNDHFLAVPSGLADLKGTFFAAEVRSKLEPGEMLVRHGLVFERTRGRPVFRLDIDRYVEGSIAIEDVSGKLSGFADDIYGTFRSAAGPALLAWMDGGES